MNHKTKDILDRIEDSSPNESSHELFCRLRDCANEIEKLRAALASRPDVQADERGAFEAWWQTTNLGERNQAWQGWKARAAAPQAKAAQGVAKADSIYNLSRHALVYLAEREYSFVKAALEEISNLAAAPSPDREQVGEETEAARIVKMWDDGFTQLAGSRAIDFLRDNASPSRECGERQGANYFMHAKDILHERGFTQHDDYFLSSGASIMSESSHEIIHQDTLRAILSACAPTLSDADILKIGYRHFKPGHNVKAEANFVAAVRDILAASEPTLGDDPCPFCPVGSVCETTKCGRLEQHAHRGVYQYRDTGPLETEDM